MPPCPARLAPSLLAALACLASVAVTSAVSAAGASASAPGETQGNSNNIFGPANPLLSEGAEAIEAGRLREGLEKTLSGLHFPNSVQDEAAGHSNACAALVALQQLDAALEHCNEAIGLDRGNWHSYNNRAAIYVARGLYDLAIADLESALAIAPSSRQLHLAMEIARRDKRIAQERSRASVAS